MKLKDVSQKNLEQYNDVFADIVNVLLFKGKVVVKPEELESVLPRSDLKLDSGKAYEQERDVLKKWKKHDIRFAIANFGIENQSTIDETMPVRVLSYDAATYMQQLKKKEKLSPVITLVLYFGTEKAWNTGMSLLEILKCSEEVKNLVNDYKINVFNVAFLPKETIELFKSDFKLVAEYLYQIKNEDDSYMPSTQEIKHVEDTMNLLKAFGSNEISLEAYNTWTEKKKEKTIMRDLLAETIIRAKNEAAAEAEVIGSIKTYREFGITDSEVKERIIKRFTLSNSQADEYLAQVVGK